MGISNMKTKNIKNEKVRAIVEAAIDWYAAGDENMSDEEVEAESDACLKKLNTAVSNWIRAQPWKLAK